MKNDDCSIIRSIWQVLVDKSGITRGSNETYSNSTLFKWSDLYSRLDHCKAYRFKAYHNTNDDEWLDEDCHQTVARVYKQLKGNSSENFEIICHGISIDKESSILEIYWAMVYPDGILHLYCTWYWFRSSEIRIIML